MIKFFKNPEEFIIRQKENNGENIKENKWKRKLSERIMRFIFREMLKMEKKLEKEKGKVENNEEDIYLNDLLNEEFKWLKLGIMHKMWEWFLKLTKKGKIKVEKYRKFDVNVFKAIRSDLLAIDEDIKNCNELKDPLLKVLQYEGGIDDPIHQEFRGRIGAQIIGSVYNAKQLTMDILKGLLWSLGGAGVIALILDLGLWPLCIFLISLSGCHLCAPIIGIFLYSLTPLAAETFDSLVIKRLLITFDGGKFFPSTLDKFLDDLKGAFKAGTIASGGSLMNNTLAMEKIAKLFGMSAIGPNLFTNTVAASTSGAMIPLEFHEWRDLQRAALYKLYDQKFLPKPNGDTLVVEWREKSKKKREKFWHKITFRLFAPKKPETSPVITNEERNLAFREHIKEKIEASMDIQKKSSMAINSMGIGSLLSQIVLITFFFPSQFGMPVVILKIALIIINTPTEIGSFVATIVSANSWWSTDTMKNKQMVRLIIDRTIKQMEHPNKEFQEIKEKEVYEIYHPKAQILYRYGKGITKFMIVFFKFMTKPSLFKQINLSKLALPFFKEDDYRQDLTFNISYLEEPLEKMLKMPGIDEEKFKGFINEIAPFHEKHKMTLTESHHFINILNEWINDKEKTDKKYSEYFKRKLQNYNKINFSVFEKLNKVCCFLKI
uniref:Uncharacterized protein n=2 Tax=Meloidogyne TaxID=189290 RepID=A0A6V7WT13_MELEN|nr:unnamed protein product [Meloidogyne enterolobii]